MRWLVLAGAVLAGSCSTGAEFTETRYAEGGRLRFRGMVERSQESPRAQGEWVFWYRSGGVQARGAFQDGAAPAPTDLEGARTRIPPDGREGPWTFWGEHGQVLARGDYVGSLRHDWWTTWFPSGQRCCAGRFEFGRPVGVHVSWHANGLVREERSYLHGVLDGPRRLWDEQGQLVWEGRYRAGFPAADGLAPPVPLVHGEACVDTFEARERPAAVAAAAPR